MPRKRKEKAPEGRKRKARLLEEDLISDKSMLKLFFREGKTIGLKIYPLPYFEAARYLDLLTTNKIKWRDLFKDLMPKLPEYVEIVESSDIKFDVSLLKSNDPDENPLKFTELREVIEALLTISGIGDPRVLIENKEIVGKALFNLKPLGVLESAELLDVFASESRFTEMAKFYFSLKDQLEVESDIVDYDSLFSTDQRENPLLLSQIYDVIYHLARVSGVLPEELETFQP